MGVGMAAGTLLLAVAGIALRLAASSLEGLVRIPGFDCLKVGLDTGQVIEALVNIVGWDRSSFLFLINDYNQYILNAGFWGFGGP